MLKYELKKLYGKKKCILLFSLILMISLSMAYIMCKVTRKYEYKIPPLEEYFAYYWLYGMAILYFVVFLHVSVFDIEEKNDMSQIILTLRAGREALASVKILVTLIVTNALVLVYIVFSLIGYSVAFELNFDIPIIERYERLYVYNSIVDTSGKMLFVNMFAFFLTANFTSLFSLYLSVRLKNAYLACILMFIGCFMTLFSLNPQVGVIFALTPLGNYIVIADGLKVIFQIGIFSITPHLLSLVVTAIVILVLVIRIRAIYANKQFKSYLHK